MTNKGLLIAGGIAAIAIIWIVRHRRAKADPAKLANDAIDAMPADDVKDLVSVKGGIGIAQIQNIPVDQLKVILKSMDAMRIAK